MKLSYKNSWTPYRIAGMDYVHNVICLTRKTIKLHTHSDSFRYVMQRKGGRTRSLGGFTWLSIDKKSVQFFFQEPL